MGKQSLSNILFWCLACLSAVMLVAMVLVVGGFVALEPPSPPGETATKALPEAAPEPSPSATTGGATTSAETTTSAATEPETPPTTAPAREAGPTLVVLTAARGDSWFSARLGSENGPLLDERVLAQGESVRFEAKRIWLSVGASGHVDVTVDGKARALAPGTVSVVLTHAGATNSS